MSRPVIMEYDMAKLKTLYEESELRYSVVQDKIDRIHAIASQLLADILELNPGFNESSLIKRLEEIIEQAEEPQE